MSFLNKTYEVFIIYFCLDLQSPILFLRRLPRVEKFVIKLLSQDFPAGAVVKNPPANAEDTGSSPGPGRSHMLWSN